MNIIHAINDPNLFRPFLGEELGTWSGWLAALRVLYGLPLSECHHEIVEKCTGRNPDSFPQEGFDAALFLTGRRSGKSRPAAVVAAYEAVLAGHEAKLAKGERGVVAVIAPTKWQGRIVRDYCRAIFETPLLARQAAYDGHEGFTLSTGTRIEILSGDFRTVRGFTLLAAIVDEVCFFGLDAECHVPQRYGVDPSHPTFSGHDRGETRLISPRRMPNAAGPMSDGSRTSATMTRTRSSGIVPAAP